MSYDIIYARQSVIKDDSVSVESQIEACKKEVTDNNYKVYTDKGYSGKNILRPDFQEMMHDIESGNVRRVIVYRLDRISRSVLDFANIMEVLEKHNVCFVSTTEKFDTSTPIGNAMLMIVMVFAELERKTIQQRVVDAYSSRSKRGFYMGGRVPFGFELCATVIDGIRTKMYKKVDSEVEVIDLIYALYSDPQTSLGDVMRYLMSHGIYNRNGKPFNRSRLRDVIINPVYVKADYMLYDFFKAQETEIANIPEDFVGTNGAYLYSGNEKKRKTVSLKGHTLVIAPHEGIVDSKTWIKCRSKCLENQSVAKPTKAKATWLAGKIKCANCGYALTAKICKCKTKADNRYYLCNNKYNGSNCSFGSLDADMVDEIVFEEMQKKLAEFTTLSKWTDESENLQTVKLKNRIDSIDKEIASLIDRIKDANEIVMDYINKRVAELDTEKCELYSQISCINHTPKSNVDELSNYMEHWDELSVSDKITVVDCLIERISASKEKIEIRWKI